MKEYNNRHSRVRIRFNTSTCIYSLVRHVCERTETGAQHALWTFSPQRRLMLTFSVAGFRTASCAPNRSYQCKSRDRM